MNTPTIGILLVQLGTPDAPTPRALRKYLRQFLSDPRVVDAPRFLWWVILRLFILPRRPARSAALYRRIWTERGSPLLLTTVEQARGLEEKLNEGGASGEARPPAVCVEVGMRYGSPAIGTALDRLAEKGADRILVCPLFPQYSATTTASVYDAVADHFRKRRVVPALRFVPPYHAHPAYVGAVVASIGEDLSRLRWKPEKVLFSFHGLPKRYVEKGDPYREHAEATTRLVVSGLGLSPVEQELCFQSRFGPQEWLEPYTDRRLVELSLSGVKRVAVACPGFVADCLETIDEIGREGRRQFLEAGGEDFHRVPCLNAHPRWIQGLVDIAQGELAGWR